MLQAWVYLIVLTVLGMGALGFVPGEVIAVDEIKMEMVTAASEGVRGLSLFLCTEHCQPVSCLAVGTEHGSFLLKMVEEMGVFWLKHLVFS